MALENTAGSSNAYENYAIYPLTRFDTMCEHAVMVFGWLVEGHADPPKISAALDNVIAKWPMLGSRLEKTKDRYRLRIPLGGYAKGYRPYILTSAASEKPLSHYIPLPIPMATNIIPWHLMKHPDTPTTTAKWMKKGFPPLCWHITHFTKGERPYSCIGLTFPHVILDGLGIAAVVHAVEAELLGKSWPVPERLLKGENINTLDAELDKLEKRRKEEGDNYSRLAYKGIAIVGAWFSLKFFAWSWWQEIWHKSGSRILIVPAKVVEKLVDDTRKSLPEEGQGRVRVSKGDVLAAFIYKTVFSDGTPPSTNIHPTSMASLRRFFNGALNLYPHNCVAPLDFPDITVGEINKASIGSLAQTFADIRSKLTEDWGLQCREIACEASRVGKLATVVKEGAETVSVTNMCIANIVNIDWTGAGAGRTMARHKLGLVPGGVNLTNIITITGFLDDGSLLLDVNFIQRRLDCLERAVTQLIQDTANHNGREEGPS